MSRTSKDEQAKILERRMQALDMRKLGFSYRKIADRLGIDHQTAWRDVNAALKHLISLGDDSADELRQLELERLDKIIEGMSNWVDAGAYNQANTIIKAIDRRAKLLGLDKPSEIKVDIHLFLELQRAADEAGVDLAKVFEALINSFALTTGTGS